MPFTILGKVDNINQDCPLYYSSVFFNKPKEWWLCPLIRRIILFINNYLPSNKSMGVHVGKFISYVSLESQQLPWGVSK